jgi:hypothetical protein
MLSAPSSKNLDSYIVLNKKQQQKNRASAALLLLKQLVATRPIGEKKEASGIY